MPFSLGTTKAKVLENWGPPASKVPMGVDELGNTKEEWIYRGMFPGFFIQQEYLAQNHQLYFVGDHLVGCKVEEAPQQSPAPSEEQTEPRKVNKSSS